LKRERWLTAPEILLSLTTAPFLFGMVAVKSLARRLEEIGQASEEVFRGDRLPVLHVPESQGEE
jgi:hypothetical protein